MAAPSDNSKEKSSGSLSIHTGEGIVVDIGTGDGRFVYRSARLNPAKFYIGIDANVKPLEKISMKSTRRPAKGGLANVLFVQAAIEDLPDEFNDVANEIHIHFPWGSLLHAVTTGAPHVLDALRRISAPRCTVEIVIGIDEVRDRSQIQRLGLPVLTPDLIVNTLLPKYEAAGFKVIENGSLSSAEWSKLETSWAKKLRSGQGRNTVYIILQAV